MRYLLLIIGIFCCSTSILFIKIGSTDPIALSAYRLLLGGFLLIPVMVVSIRKSGGLNIRKTLAMTLPPAVFLGIHFVSWIIGARMTSVANASLIVNMVPVAMPFLLYFVVSEKISRLEGIGTFAAMLGVLLLGASDFHLSRAHAIGDVVCFFSMLFYAFYLVFARKNKDLPSIYVYIVPVYLIAGLLCLATAAVVDLSGGNLMWIGPDLKTELISILGLAIVPTLLGHTLINSSFRHFRGQVVSIFNLSQFIFAGTLGFLILGEIPHLLFYLASIFVVIGSIITLMSSEPA
jgi:drug/metabolite transporter (DMT)-like permease